MNRPSLRDFVNHALETRRIRFGDLRRLQRDILPARIASREEAAMLLDLDRAVQTADRDWNDYLVGNVRDFVIWGMAPIGVLDREKADWLLTAVSNGGLTKNGRTIFREVAREVPRIDDGAALPPVASPKRQPRNRDALEPAGESDLPALNHAAA